MSCENGPNKISKLAGQVGAGISRLAGKRAFYIGLALGAGGAAGSLALAKTIRKRRLTSLLAGDKRQPVSIGSVPGPLAKPRQLSKGALRQAVGTRANPKKISREALNTPGTQANPRQIPILADRPTETKLEAATIPIQTGPGQPFTPENSYRVIRPDGSETGLAITPYVQEDDRGQPVEDDRRWGVTHAASGSLISGPYDSLAQAQGLAGRLTALQWTAAQVPVRDVSEAKRIIMAYQRQLEPSTPGGAQK